MIKLFWNTHNQKKTIADNNIDKEEALNLKWGIYHKKKFRYLDIRNIKILNFNAFPLALLHLHWLLPAGRR